MPLSVQVIQDRYQRQIAPGNNTEFYRLCSEADERIIEMGTWHWSRARLELTPDEDRMVQLPEAYKSIVACRLDNIPKGVRWEESEFFEEGMGELPISGCNAMLVDQGLVEGVRTFKVVGENIESVHVLAKYDVFDSITDAQDYVRCPSPTALKLMMLSIIYEEANDVERAMQYESMSIKKIKELEKSYRGIAKEVVSPNHFVKLPRNRRTNIR